MEELLSHKEVLGRVIRDMETWGYLRYKFPESYLSIGNVKFIPDSIFYKEGDQVVDAVEVKPGYASSGEIIAGIGQCLAYLSLGFRPFLVVTPYHLDYLLPISQPVPQIGIICCYNDAVVIVSMPAQDKTLSSSKILNVILKSRQPGSPATIGPLRKLKPIQTQSRTLPRTARALVLLNTGLINGRG